MSTEGKFSFFLRDKNYSPIALLDTWLSFTIVIRFNRIGTWNLEVPTSSKLAALCTPDTGIIVKYNNVTIFSGSAGTDYRKTKDVIKMSGEDDNALLRSLARPTPTLAQAPYPDEYDVFTSTASSVMQRLVYYNIGPGAPTSPVFWRILQLSVGGDPLLGDQITSRARFDPLITLLYSLAATPQAGGLGFKIVQSDVILNQIDFSIYQPRDLHEDMVFSVDLKTADDYEYVKQHPGSNYFIVAGGDDFGENRTVVEGGDVDSIQDIGRIIPEFVDKRGVTDLGELYQSLAEKLATSIVVEQITVTPSATDTIEFVDDYFVGDYVTAVVDGVSYPRLITEIEIDFDPSRGAIIKPLVADPSATNDTLGATHLATLQDRLSNIERNYNVPDDSITDDMLHPSMKWLAGDMKASARATAQPGWLLCNGTELSRGFYGDLFDALGTEYGVGNGTTTFNIPNQSASFFMGAGDGYARGDSGGGTASFVHTHRHSHGMGHTHPGNHSHGLHSHTHTFGSHTHEVDLSHDHPVGDTSGIIVFSTPVGGHNAVTSSLDHRHTFNVAPYSVSVISGGASGTTSGPPSTSDTESDSNTGTFAAVPDGTEPDETPGGGTSVAIVPKYFVGNWMIYTGVP